MEGRDREQADYPDDAKNADAEQGHDGRQHGVAYAAHYASSDFHQAAERVREYYQPQSLLTGRYDRGAGGVYTEELLFAYDGERAERQAYHSAAYHSRPEHFVNAVYLAGAHVLAREGYCRLIEGFHREIYERFYVVGCAAAGHDGGAECVYRRLYDDVRE